jgi:exosortase K
MKSKSPVKSERWAENRLAAVRENGIHHAAGILLILAVKLHYSTADAEALRWILTPVAGLVALLSGMNFEWLPQAGFVNHAHSIVIAPACAGVNFLIICFASLFFTFVSRQRKDRAKCAWFALSATIAYLVTLAANSLRIILSVFLYDAPIYAGWLTPGRVHQLAGTVLFISLLVPTWLIVERMVRRSHPPAQAGGGPGSRDAGGLPVSAIYLPAPFAWYGLITIVVPLLNGAFRLYGSEFVEHSVMVMLACGCVFLITARLMKQGEKRVDRPD